MKQLILFLVLAAVCLAKPRNTYDASELMELAGNNQDMIQLLELIANEEMKQKESDKRKTRKMRRMQRKQRKALAVPAGEDGENDNDGWDRVLAQWNHLDDQYEEPKIPSAEEGKKFMKKYCKEGKCKFPKERAIKIRRIRGKKAPKMMKTRAGQEDMRRVRRLPRRDFTKMVDADEGNIPMHPWKKANKDKKYKRLNHRIRKDKKEKKAKHYKRMQSAKKIVIKHESHGRIIVSVEKPHRHHEPAAPMKKKKNFVMELPAGDHYYDEAMVMAAMPQRPQRRGRMMKTRMASPPPLMEEELPQYYKDDIQPPREDNGDVPPTHPSKPKKCPIKKYFQKTLKSMGKLRKRLSKEPAGVKVTLALAIAAIITMQIWVISQIIALIAGKGDTDEDDEDEERGKRRRNGKYHMVPSRDECDCSNCDKCNTKKPHPAEIAATIELKQ